MTLRDRWVHSVSKAVTVRVADHCVGQMAAAAAAAAAPKADSVFHSWDPVPVVQV